MKVVQSTCNYCAVDCNLDFHVKNNKIVKVVPTKGYPVNDGFACIKGLSLDKQQTTVDRPPIPKIKQEDGSYKYVSWDEGFKYVADKLLELQDKYGPESIAGISTGQLTLEEFALYGHVMRNYLKTNVDGNTRLCMATAAVAHNQSYGFDAPGFTLKDAELSDTIILIGANPVVAHPILWEKIAKNKHKKLIVIDPRKSETAHHADYWYGLKSDSDLVLLYTVANLLIEKDYIDRDYIEKSTEGFEDFKEFVKSYSLEKGAKATNLKEEEILELVELINQGERVSLWWTMGINHGYEGVRSAQAIINIALMTGNIGREGTGANSITGQCNAMGSRAYSNTTTFHGGGSFTDPERRKQVAKALQVDESLLAVKPTAPYNEIIERINSGEIKGLWIVCTNPRHSWTNNETFARAVEKLEIFVVQDVYDDTESAELATVFFPAVSGIKKEGNLINMERRVAGIRPCLEKIEDERDDYEIIYGVGKALGMGPLLDLWKTPQDCFELMKECSRGMPCDMTGMTWEGLEESNGIQWPFKEGDVLKDDQRRLYEDGKFYHPSGKAKFIFQEPMEDPLPLTAEFPYIFNTGRGTVGQWHTQSRTREVEFIKDITIKEAYLYMNTKVAKDHDIKENDHVRVYSSNGEDAVFLVKVTDNVSEKQLYAPIHYIECNKLTPSVYDPYSREPAYKSAPVYFEKIVGSDDNEENKN